MRRAAARHGVAHAAGYAAAPAGARAPLAGRCVTSPADPADHAPCSPVPYPAESHVSMPGRPGGTFWTVSPCWSAGTRLAVPASMRCQLACQHPPKRTSASSSMQACAASSHANTHQSAPQQALQCKHALPVGMPTPTKAHLSKLFNANMRCRPKRCGRATGLREAVLPCREADGGGGSGNAAGLAAGGACG